jgi:hypothetical protein
MQRSLIRGFGVCPASQIDSRLGSALETSAASRRPGPSKNGSLVSWCNGQALAFVYFEEEPGRRSAENLMSHDEAGALALNIAKLPELLRKV